MPRSPHSGGSLAGWGHGSDSGGHKFIGNLDAQVRDRLAAGQLVPDRAASPTTERQLKYLNTRKGGNAALRAAGVSERTLRRWRRQGSRPTGANVERVNRAYWQLRGSNLKRGRPLPSDIRRAVGPKVMNRMHGRSMTVIPVGGDAVEPQARGAQQVAADKLHTASERTMRPSNARWDEMVNAWIDGDVNAFDEVWMDYAGDIDSPPEPYYEVRHIGFML